MRRGILSFAILFVILASSIFMLIFMKSYNDKMVQKIDRAENFWARGEYEKTLAVVREIEDFWEKYHVAMSYIVPSEQMNEVAMTIAKLEPLLLLESVEFYAECESIRYALDFIYDDEFPSVHSVL